MNSKIGRDNMRTVLVTGAHGFVGRNLTAHLQVNKEIRVLRFDIDHTEQELRTYLNRQISSFI